MLHAWSDGKGGQKVEDTGPLTTNRMPTIDMEIHSAATNFMYRLKNDKPFFVWFNSTRMHVWTRLKKASDGRTGIGLYPDGMVEHDDMVGQLLKQLDDLGIADNTIVMYSTDNGAETRPGRTAALPRSTAKRARPGRVASASRWSSGGRAF